MISPLDTIAAIATPPGEGGLGVIRVSGARAISVIEPIFSSSKIKDLSTVSSHTCHVGKIMDGNELIDRVVVTLFRSPHSYTGEDVVEISAHGNPYTLQKIMTLIMNSSGLAPERHVRVAGPGEFTERAFLNRKMDLTQAEAVAELIRAKADKSQAAALAQLRGDLSTKVRHLRSELLPLLAHIEVGLDHADDEHHFLSRAALVTGCEVVEHEIDALLQSARISKILREGLRVALLGKPNVGKSSLLNALLKEERAIVTPIPGTTRDTLEECVNWNGIPVVLTDTAGLRQHSQDPVEQVGMERTRRSLEESDVVVGLFDGSEDLTEEDHEVIRHTMTKPHLWVINKCDLPQRNVADALQSFNGHTSTVSLSAKTGSGLEVLVTSLTRLALDEKVQTAEARWLLNARHQAALERARVALARASGAAQSEAYEECVALELQVALQALGEIVGETTTDDLLGQIFSQFCIGK